MDLTASHAKRLEFYRCKISYNGRTPVKLLGVVALLTFTDCSFEISVPYLLDRPERDVILTLLSAADVTHINLSKPS